MVSDLLCLEVKLEEEDQALLLLSLFLASYDYLLTTILYGNKSLEMEKVTTTLLNNEIMMRSNPSEESSRGFFY